MQGRETKSGVTLAFWLWGDQEEFPFEYEGFD